MKKFLRDSLSLPSIAFLGLPWLSMAPGGMIAAQENDAAIKSEERAAFSNSLFDGSGVDVPWVLTRGPQAAPAAAAGAGPVGASAAAPPERSGLSLDRLSASDPTGYSPQVLILQSRLNADRPPGTPELRITGRLDYQTLAFPALILRADLDSLSQELGRLPPAGGPGKAKGTPWTTALQKARTAIDSFARAALSARDPSRIRPSLLRELSLRQKEAERWASIAWLEGDLSRLGVESRFLTPDLRATIKSLPEPAASRDDYLRAGETRRRLLASLEHDDKTDARLLESAGWLAHYRSVRQAIADNQRQELILDRSVRLYAAVPYALSELAAPQPAPKRLLEKLTVRFFPDSRRAKEIETRLRRLRQIEGAFLQIAAEKSAPRSVAGRPRPPGS